MTRGYRYLRQVPPQALVCLLALWAPTLIGRGQEESTRQWPAWRGPLGNGVAPHGNPPVEWSETRNVRWKVPVPGRGTSTPVVWGDLVFVLTAVPASAAPGAAPAPQADPAGPPAGGFSGMVEGVKGAQTFTVLAFDRATGRLRWQHGAREQTPHEGHHKDHGYASASPVTDGTQLFAWFGSHGLYAYDLAGRLLWEKDLGDMQTRNSFGEGSSPALYRNTLVLLWDHEGDDFLVALDKRDGRELWRQARDEPTGWSTPLVVEHDGQPQVIVNGTQRMRAYDLASGRLLWECAGQTANAIPSPVAAHGMVYLTSGFRGSALYAIRLGRTGGLAGTDAIAWQRSRHTPYVPSPLLYDGLLYFFAGNNATLSVVDAISGEPRLEAERLEGLYGVYASPVGAAGRVYVLGRDGNAMVLRHGATLEVLARNRLEDGFDASPAVVDQELFLRGRQHLYCLAESAPRKTAAANPAHP